jgi:hypothetical protein
MKLFVVSSLLILVAFVFLTNGVKLCERKKNETILSQAKEKQKPGTDQEKSEPELLAPLDESNPPITPENASQGNEPEGYWLNVACETQLPNWLTISGWLVAAGIAGLTLKALFDQVAANIESANAAKLAVEIADKSMKVDKRAYMVIPGVGTINFSLCQATANDQSHWRAENDRSHWADVSYTIKNIGTTPAKIKYIKVDFYEGIGVPGLPTLKIAPVVENSPPYEQIIPAGFPWEQTIRHHFRSHMKWYEALNVPGRGFSLHGIIVYFDIFNDPHYTRFCWRYRGPSLIGPLEANPRPWTNEAIPPEYNDSD